MATQEKQVFFIATKLKNKPVNVSFYTKAGERVAFESVKKVKTKEGVHFVSNVKK